MAVLKCKMCGGELTFEKGATVCECEYCGSKQTIPNVDDEKRVKLYERANRLRLNNEFDKAYVIYEVLSLKVQRKQKLLADAYGIEVDTEIVLKNKDYLTHYEQVHQKLKIEYAG